MKNLSLPQSPRLPRAAHSYFFLRPTLPKCHDDASGAFESGRDREIFEVLQIMIPVGAQSGDGISWLSLLKQT